MSNHARRYKLAEFRERRLRDAGIEVETDDGTVFVIPPPELWPDAVGRIASSNLDAAFRMILGDETFDEFVAKGGSARVLDAIILDAQGLPTGE